MLKALTFANVMRVYSTMKPVERSIYSKLKETFKPIHLDVLNESHMHNVPPNSETHFKVIVVSDDFDKVPLIKTKSPSEWESSNQEVTESPPCRGGFGK
ncbi:BolA-like protein [Gryllus bimaculatus]|nr:BolA-like protein [Gryllus bimaculatus]